MAKGQLAPDGMVDMVVEGVWTREMRKGAETWERIANRMRNDEFRCEIFSDDNLLKC